MLVLTRKSGESILVGDEIRIRILKVNGSRVRVGIEAPTSLRILREKAEQELFLPLDPAADVSDPNVGGDDRLRNPIAPGLAVVAR
jgi:carbon storage regulator